MFKVSHNTNTMRVNIRGPTLLVPILSMRFQILDWTLLTKPIVFHFFNPRLNTAIKAHILWYAPKLYFLLISKVNIHDCGYMIYHMILCHRPRT